MNEPKIGYRTGSGSSTRICLRGSCEILNMEVPHLNSEPLKHLWTVRITHYCALLQYGVPRSGRRILEKATHGQLVCKHTSK